MLPLTSPVYIHQLYFSCFPLFCNHDNLSGGTLGQFEDSAWPDFTCRPIYEQLTGTHIYPGNLTGMLSDVCLSWIGNGSNLVAWDECAGWTEWVHSTCQGPGLLHRDHRAVTVSHHCCFFQPWPLTPPPHISLGRDGAAMERNVRLSAAGLSESQSVVEIYDACRPFVQQAVPTSMQQLSSAWSDEHGGAFFLPSSPLL